GIYKINWRVSSSAAEGEVVNAWLLRENVHPLIERDRRTKEIRVAILWDEASQTPNRVIHARSVTNDDELQQLIHDEHQALIQAKNQSISVTIDADPRVPWTEVITAMGLSRRAGVDTIEFAMGAANK